MVRIAHERIDDLFALASVESFGDHPELANRYVVLARKIGTRYNVRLTVEYGELYCRGCSAYWVEGRTVRTRLRSGRRVRTCLVCGRERRRPIRPRSSHGGGVPAGGPPAAPRDDAVPLVSFPEPAEPSDEETEEE